MEIKGYYDTLCYYKTKLYLMDYKVLGVNGGNGVLLHPLKNNLLANLEVRSIFYTIDHYQWKANFGNIPMVKEPNKDYSKADVIMGHPDCGNSSPLRLSRSKKNIPPSDNASVQVFYKTVKKYKPRIIMLENLSAFEEKQDLKAVFNKYHLKVIKGPVTLWGNSQKHRIRMVLIGLSKKHYKKKHLKYFTPYQINPLKTCRELIGEWVKCKDKDINYQYFNLREPDSWFTSLYYRGERRITIGQARKIWNEEMGDSTKWVVNDFNLKNQPGIFKLLKDIYPFTVKKQNRQFDWKGNMLTPRQLALIQGVPLEFKLPYPKNTDLKYALNKARTTVTKCPPYEIGVWFKECLENLYSRVDSS